MKKIITFIACVTLSLSSIVAQQIKGSFDVWEDCYPDGTNLVGKKPVGWTASNVFQIIVGKEFVFPDTGRTGMGAKIMNDFVGLGTLGANAPAFVSLGKMWVFADMMGMLSGNDMSNGGVNGGIDFTYRPDSLTVYYKRKLGTQKPNETAKVLVYLWKGTFKSKVINGHEEEATYEEIDDQERAVLGMEGVIPAETKGDGVLIAKTEYTIDKATEGEDWVRLSIPVKYVEGENGKLVPEKMNIIFSGCNYWVRADIGKENTLWVDDAAFVYNAKLRSLKLDAVDVVGFDPEVYTYVLPYKYRNKVITAEAFGKDAQIVESTVEEVADKVVKTIKVTCGENATSDVNKVYTYTLTFEGSYVGDITSPENLNQVYGDAFSIGFTSTNTEVPFTYTIGDENVLKYDSESKKFYAIGAGTTTVIAHQTKEGYLPTASSPVKVNIAKVNLTMTLKAWCQRGKSISFNTSSPDAYNGINYGVDFDFEGLKNQDGEGTLVDVIHKVFNTKNIYISSGSAGKEEVVGEVRKIEFSFTGSTDPLTTVSTNNYNVTFVNNGAEIRKTFLVVYPSYKIDEATYSLNKDEAQTSYPVGSAIQWKVNYSGFVYNEKDAVMAELGKDTVVVVLDKASETVKAGTVVPVSVRFPQMLLRNYEFKTYTDLSVKALNAYTLENNEAITKVYGNDIFEVPFVVKNNQSEALNYTITSSNTKVVAVSGKNVTIKTAGDAYLTVKVAGNEEYTPLAKRVNISVAKAPFKIKVKEVELPLGKVAPETFEFEFEGFVNNEDSAKVFKKAPTATLEKQIPVDAKVGDTFAIIINPGESVNYDLQTVNGVLRIIGGVGIDTNQLSTVVVYSTNGAICFANKAVDQVVEVYTVQGAKVYEGTDAVVSDRIQRNAMYVVRIGSSTTKVIVK